MFRQKLNPEVIPYLNIYDYSDILYNYFKREDTKEGESVTIFLGARRSFIKDVFLKQEKWLRNFFKRHNYDERYYEALIKSAQGRGVTCNLILKSSSRDFVYDYIRNRRRHFAAYIREQAQSGNHIQNIIEHLETQGKPLTDEMRNFIAANENSFRDHLSRKHITGRHVNAVFELLEEPKFPLYLKENLKSLITGNEKAYTDFLLNKGLSSSEVKSLLDKIKARPADNLDAALPSEFARQNPELFKAGLQKENRDENYIKFAFNVLNPPPLPEYVQESLLNFIIANEKDAATHNNPDTAVVRDVAKNGITPDNYPAVRKYVLKNRKEYSDYYKQNNILTYQELNEQLTDITNFMIKPGAFRFMPKISPANSSAKTAMFSAIGTLIFRFTNTRMQPKASINASCNEVSPPTILTRCPVLSAREPIFSAISAAKKGWKPTAAKYRKYSRPATFSPREPDKVPRS